MKVKLHSNDEAAAEAVDRTLKMLPGGYARLKRDTADNVEFDAEGYATVLSDDPGFVAFALKNQGYVLEVIG